LAGKNVSKMVVCRVGREPLINQSAQAAGLI